MFENIFPKIEDDLDDEAARLIAALNLYKEQKPLAVKPEQLGKDEITITEPKK